MHPYHKHLLHRTSQEIDAVISSKFSTSYLNDSKWHKLMEGLTDAFGSLFLHYKLIYDEEITAYLVDQVDEKPFFMEPILYREVEWIAFPRSYTYWVNMNNLKAGKRQYEQSLEAIATKIQEIGKFQMEVEEERLMLYAYA